MQAMTWTLYIVAVEGHRLYSRILQVLEGQRVCVCAFSGETSATRVCVTVTITSEEDRIYRIEALLHRLENIHSVAVLPNHKSPACDARNPKTPTG